MNRFKRNIRGLQDIRTISGSVDQTTIPYKAYMKISCLEMEKARRGKERESAIHRIKNIDARFKEIESEKDAILQKLGEQNSANPVKAKSLHRCGGGFKIRY